jgi:hypothetical protein
VQRKKTGQKEEKGKSREEREKKEQTKGRTPRINMYTSVRPLQGRE